MPAVDPLSEAEVRVTVFPSETALSLYCATSPERATFEGVFSSPAGTFTKLSALLSVIVMAVVRSYVFVAATMRDPLMVNGR